MSHLTPGEKFLIRKAKKQSNLDLILLIGLVLLLAIILYFILFPPYAPKVAVAPVGNPELCRQVMEGKWSVTVDVFQFCERLENT